MKAKGFSEAAKHWLELKTRRLAGSCPGVSNCLATMRAIGTAIMVVVVLGIMLLGVNMAALRILRLMQSRPLLAGHYTIGLGAVFHIVYALLATLQSSGFTLRQTARCDALIDPLLLIGLPLINPWGIGLGKSQDGKSQRNGDDRSEIFHVFLLNVG
jgi:hypothetical protein